MRKPPRIETLEPVAIALRDALQRIEAAKPSVFRIAFQGGRGSFVPDNGYYYLRSEMINAGRSARCRCNAAAYPFRRSDCHRRVPQRAASLR
jgi:hypothetical protein